MRAANRGDADAYRHPLQELAPVLRRVASRHGHRCGSEYAEDVVQETLLALQLKRHTWDETRPLVPWVRAIAKNKLADGLRGRGHKVYLPIDDIAEMLADEPAAVTNGF